MSVQPDSGVADLWATITWPGTEVACGLSLSLADCTFMLENRDSCIFELLDSFLTLWPPVRVVLWVDAESGWLHVALFHVLLEGIFITPDWPTLFTEWYTVLVVCFTTKSCPHAVINYLWPPEPSQNMAVSAFYKFIDILQVHCKVYVWSLQQTVPLIRRSGGVFQTSISSDGLGICGLNCAVPSTCVDIHCIFSVGVALGFSEHSIPNNT